jgi:transcriptional regulator with XRE-family HTH domain
MLIKEILSEKNMTVQDLADKLGVSRQALSRQIGGKLLVETAEKIAQVLDVPLWRLFAREEEISVRPGASAFRCPHCGKEIAIKLEKNG